MKPFLLIIAAALAVAALPAQATVASQMAGPVHQPSAAELRAQRDFLLNRFHAGSLTEPYIEAIHGRHVRVRVPAGFDRVTLQQRVLSRAPARPGGSLDWKTIATDYPRGAEKVIKIKLRTLVGERHLRVFGNKFEPLPGSLLTGLTNFLPDPLTDANGGNNPTVSVRGNPGVMTLAGTDSVTSNFKEGGGGGEPRAVVESDIWRVDGDRLYFFNELRGLQSFDLSNPDAPALLGTLRLPGSGENMYLLGSTHAVLLKPSTNWWGGWIGGDVITLRVASNGFLGSPRFNGSEGSELIIADVRAGAPKLVARVPVDGSIAESRLVGSVLYLATNVNRTATDTTPAEYGLQLTSFDLADPTAPVLRGSVFLGGWANAVSATDRYFLVAKYASNNASIDGSWSSNSIDLIDISASDGTMRRAGQALVVGNINSKFNLDIEGDVLTAVAEVWGERTVETPNGPTTRWITATRLQTFSIANPDAPAPLGSVEIAPGESLRAARFDAGRAYVVTFRQIDPLFVVDLSDPVHPTVSGEVEAPGFSTYIEPLGDRLVTIGLVDWRPAVSLFDVSNPAAPTLLSQINLGNGDDWSHSEAVWNEKAFKVLPEKNLILVPVSGHGEKEGWFSRVQLLDLFRDKVVKRGAIAHEFSPRRATVMNKAVVAISPTRLVTVDASNRDEPKLLADLEIAWRVDRVFVVGPHLVQLGGSADWNDSRPPTLSVSPKNDPDDIRNLVELGDLPVIGSELNDGVLYLAQGKGRYRYYWDEPPGDEFAKQTLTVSAYDLSELPRLRLLGKTSVETRLSADELTAHWPSPGILVWSQTGTTPVWWGRIWYDPPPYRLNVAGAALTKSGAGTLTPGGAGTLTLENAPGNGTLNVETSQTLDTLVIGAGATVTIGDPPSPPVPEGDDSNNSDGSDDSNDNSDDSNDSDDGGGVVDPPGYWAHTWFYGNTSHLVAFDVTRPQAPKFLSDITVGEDQPWELSQPFATEGMLYLSYRFFGDVKPASGNDNTRTQETSDGPPDPGSDAARANRHFLVRVDYADPAQPEIDDTQVNLPGQLRGLARAGHLLFTAGQDYNLTNGVAKPSAAALHVSAFDGSAAHLLDTLPLRSTYDPVAVVGETIYTLETQPAQIWFPRPYPIFYTLNADTAGVAKAIAVDRIWWGGWWKENDKNSVLATWKLDDTGKFTSLDSIEAGHDSSLFVFGNLLATTDYSRTLQLFDATDPSALLSIGAFSFDGWVTPDVAGADGSLESGLWVPLGNYGVERIALPAEVAP